jgi:hypothetical protein
MWAIIDLTKNSDAKMHIECERKSDDFIEGYQCLLDKITEILQRNYD